MRGSTGILLIAVGLIALYIVLSDKYTCFVNFAQCLTGQDLQTSEGFTNAVGTIAPIMPIAPTANSPLLKGDAQTFTDIWGLFKSATGIQ